MPSHNVRSVLSTIVNESATLQLLRDNPEEFAKKFNLNEAELGALKNADLLFVSKNPILAAAGGSTITFTTGSTITGRRLVDLSEDRLILVLDRVLTDPTIANNVRSVLGLPTE